MANGGTVPWSFSYTWRIENFAKLTSEKVRSPCFEAGICTWRLRVHPNGAVNGVKGNSLPVFLETQDAMWAPSAEYKLTLVNQTDASKSLSHGTSTAKFITEDTGFGYAAFITLPALRTASSGWLLNDTLVIKVDVTVEREERFLLDAGGVPCNVTLKLVCGAEIALVSQILQLASPFFRGALEGRKGRGPIPVEGSLGAWTYILSDLFPQHEPPSLTIGSVYMLLPVVHKYNFTKLLARMVAFFKEKSEVLFAGPAHPNSCVVLWLVLAERLQLDELRELCFGRFRGMTRTQLEQFILLPGALLLDDAVMERGIREEMRRLTPATCFKIVAIMLAKCPA